MIVEEYSLYGTDLNYNVDFKRRQYTLAQFLYKMGIFIAKHKWSAVIAWIVIVAAIFHTQSATNAPKFDNQYQNEHL